MSMSWKQNESTLDKSRLSHLIRFFKYERLMKSMIGITGSSYDFTTLCTTSYLKRLTRYTHYQKPDVKGSNYFYLGISLSNAVLLHAINSIVIRFANRIQRLLVPKFYLIEKIQIFLEV